MRIRWSLTVMSAVLAFGTAAQAQQPVDPYGTAEVAGSADDPPQPINPYGYPYGYGYGQYPAPPVNGYQEPSTGPAAAPATPPAYQDGYYLYPTKSSKPAVYYAPPAYGYGYGYSSGNCCGRCSTGCTQLSRPLPIERIRRFSLGVHAGAFWVNQSVAGHDVTLGGAGLQLRIRSKGRFGLELNQSFLQASLANGNFVRSSFPFTFSLMLYLFPNKDERHFNIYGLAGFGAMMDSVSLIDENNSRVNQDFLEWMGHVGGGLEMRWKWFAIEADARVTGLLLEKSSAPARYYAGVSGGPIPDKSWGVQANAFMSFWF
jgi:hypothetical protein